MIRGYWPVVHLIVPGHIYIRAWCGNTIKEWLYFRQRSCCCLRGILL